MIMNNFGYFIQFDHNGPAHNGNLFNLFLLLFDKQSSRLQMSKHCLFFLLSFPLFLIPFSHFDDVTKWSCFFFYPKKKDHVYEWVRSGRFKRNWVRYPFLRGEKKWDFRSTKKIQTLDEDPANNAECSKCVALKLQFLIPEIDLSHHETS